MKRTLAILLCAMLTMSSMAACGKKEEEKVPEVTPPPVEEPTAPEDETAPETKPDANADEKLIEARDAVKKALGDGYMPDMALETNMLKEVYGINMDNVEAFLAEGAMMSTMVDNFIGFKAKEGKVADVEAQVKAYREKLVTDTMQYPSNLAKINASQVITKGDYVFFVMVGAINENMDASEEEQVKFATEEMKKATDAIDSVFA